MTKAQPWCSFQDRLMDKTRWHAQDMMAVCVRLLDLLLSPNTLHAGARGRRGSRPRRRRRAAGGAAAARQPHGLEQGAHAAHEQDLDLPRHGQVCWCASTHCTILRWSALQQPACILLARRPAVAVYACRRLVWCRGPACAAAYLFTLACKLLLLLRACRLSSRAKVEVRNGVCTAACAKQHRLQDSQKLMHRQSSLQYRDASTCRC